MTDATLSPAPQPKWMTITGWVLTALFALFMAGASVVPKFFMPAMAGQILTDLGWPDGYVMAIGMIELGCLILYLIPRTSLLGAVLFMGLFGGAMATNVRAETPLFSHQLFSLYLGVIMWGGLWLRSPWLRAVFPFRR